MIEAKCREVRRDKRIDSRCLLTGLGCLSRARGTTEKRRAYVPAFVPVRGVVETDERDGFNIEADLFARLADTGFVGSLVSLDEPAGQNPLSTVRFVRAFQENHLAVEEDDSVRRECSRSHTLSSVPRPVYLTLHRTVSSVQVTRSLRDAVCHTPASRAAVSLSAYDPWFRY